MRGRYFRTLQKFHSPPELASLFATLPLSHLHSPLEGRMFEERRILRGELFTVSPPERCGEKLSGFNPNSPTINRTFLRLWRYLSFVTTFPRYLTLNSPRILNQFALPFYRPNFDGDPMNDRRGGRNETGPLNVKLFAKTDYNILASKRNSMGTLPAV